MTHAAMERRPLTLAEAAEYLGLSRSALRKWRQAGDTRFPLGYLAGGRLRYDLDDLEAFLEAGRRGDAAEFLWREQQRRHLRTA